MLSEMFDSLAHWDRLHEQPRFRPMYPTDSVVRFLMANRDVFSQNTRFLDIGLGAGRHTKLAAELGFRAVGIDTSFVGIRHAFLGLLKQGLHANLAQSQMSALPFCDDTFAQAVSYGVFYYGLAAEMMLAISELHRVLAPRGRALVVTRTTDDYRFGKGVELEPQTFQLNISDTNELDSIQHFLSEGDVPRYFAQFSRLSFERAETTFGNRTGVNSDWLITVEK